MDIILRMCACDPQPAKEAKWQQAVQLYMAFATKAGSFKEDLLSKTGDGVVAFYYNNQMINEVRR